MCGGACLGTVAFYVVSVALLAGVADSSYVATKGVREDGGGAQWYFIACPPGEFRRPSLSIMPPATMLADTEDPRIRGRDRRNVGSRLGRRAWWVLCVLAPWYCRAALVCGTVPVASRSWPPWRRSQPPPPALLSHCHTLGALAAGWLRTAGRMHGDSIYSDIVDVVSKSVAGAFTYSPR